MLKKIKKFKINLRPSFVARALKKKLMLDSIDSSFEKIVEEEIARLNPSIVPSAVYNTFTKRESPQPLSVLWEQASNKAISISLVAASAGEKLESIVQQGQDSFKVALTDASAWESVEQSNNFVYRLLGEEANLEGCECSPLFPVPESQISTVMVLLESEKVGIRLNSSSQLTPLYSKISYCFWSSVLKR